MGKLLLSLAALLAFPQLASAAEDLRNYEEGPLTSDDFRASVPAGTVKDAMTATRLRFEYRYEYRDDGRQTTVTVAGVNVHSFIQRDASWNRRPENKPLLEHEQGHADISWIQCLKARLAYDEKIRGGKKWSATAPTLKEAIAKLERELAGFLATFEQAGREADVQYDRESRHGLAREQAEWRRVHAETIKRLEAEWKARR
jgi:hypothetical protein